MKKTALILVSLFMAAPAIAHDTHADATYMANEAVLVVQGDTKIMFDPFFAKGFNNYQLVPADMKAKVMGQSAPFDGIDAVFVSHVHGDHFDAFETIAYLRVNTDVNVFISEQGAAQVRSIAGDYTVTRNNSEEPVCLRQTTSRRDRQACTRMSFDNSSTSPAVPSTKMRP